MGNSSQGQDQFSATPVAPAAPAAPVAPAPAPVAPAPAPVAPAPVAEAAAAALISRTTAYRYFPNQTSLLVAAHPETVAVSLLPPGVGDDVEKRLLAAVKAFLEKALEP